MRSRSARFVSCSSGGWMVVFCSVMTHLPASPRAFAASAAALICSRREAVELLHVVDHHRAVLGRP